MRTAYDLPVAIGTSLLSLDDIHLARERIGNRLHRTPLLPSRTLSEHAGVDVHFKAELFQRTGSFKPRGVLSKLATLSEDEKRRGKMFFLRACSPRSLAETDGPACWSAFGKSHLHCSVGTPWTASPSLI